jgi:hypothetical protein
VEQGEKNEYALRIGMQEVNMEQKVVVIYSGH